MDRNHSHQTWGKCKNCEHFQIEPAADALDATMGVCVHEDLHPYQLRVSGASGCNCFEQGEPARAAGSSEMPRATANSY